MKISQELYCLVPEPHLEAMVQQLCVVRMVSRCAVAVLEMKGMVMWIRLPVCCLSVCLIIRKKQRRIEDVKQAMFSLWMYIQYKTQQEKSVFHRTINDFCHFTKQGERLVDEWGRLYRPKPELWTIKISYPTSQTGSTTERLVGEIKSAAIAAFAYAYPEYLTLCLSHSLPQ